MKLCCDISRRKDACCDVFVFKHLGGNRPRFGTVLGHNLQPPRRTIPTTAIASTVTMPSSFRSSAILSGRNPHSSRVRWSACFFGSKLIARDWCCFLRAVPPRILTATERLCRLKCREEGFCSTLPSATSSGELARSQGYQFFHRYFLASRTAFSTCLAELNRRAYGSPTISAADTPLNI